MLLEKKCVAVIGAGKWGANHVRQWAKLGALHTICDTDESRLQDLQEKYPEVATCLNPEDLWENTDIDRVVIALPAPLHYDFTKKALESGKHVLVEKPICLAIEEAEKLVALSKRYKRQLMVGHLLQYHPCFIEMNRKVKEGDLGQVLYVSSNRLKLGNIRHEENVLWSFSPHDVSMVLSLCGGSLPTEVLSQGAACLQDGIEDVVTTHLSFKNGVQGHIHASWIHPFKEQKIVVAGTQGMLVFDDTKSWNEKLQFTSKPFSWKDGNIVANQAESEFIEVSENSPLELECLHFMQCCDKEEKPITDGEEGLRVLKVLSASEKSLKEKRKIKCSTDFQNPKKYYAHESAIIDEDAEIGEGSKIWHNSHIMRGSYLGKNCNLGKNVIIHPDVSLGKNVKVQNNVSVYSGTICQDDVFLGPSAVFTNVKNPRSAVNRRGEYLQTILEKGCTVGANATIVCGIRLGEYSFVGAGAVVTKDIPDYSLVLGNPAKHMGWMSRSGYRLDLPSTVSEQQRMIAQCVEGGDYYLLSSENNTSYITYLGTLSSDDERTFSKELSAMYARCQDLVH